MESIELACFMRTELGSCLSNLQNEVGYQLRPGVENRFQNRQAHMGRTPGRKPLGRAKKKKGSSVRL